MREEQVWRQFAVYVSVSMYARVMIMHLFCELFNAIILPIVFSKYKN